MFKSLRWRLQFWHALILCLVVIGFGVLTYLQQRHERFRQIDNELAAAIEVLVGKLQTAPPRALESLKRIGTHASDSLSQEERDEWERLDKDLRLPDTFGPRHPDQPKNHLPYFVIWTGEDTILKASDSVIRIALPTGDEPKRKKGKAKKRRRTPRSQTFRNQGQYRESYAPGPNGLSVLVGRSVVRDFHALNRAAGIMTGIGVAVLLLGLACGSWLAKQVIRPIESMSRVASEISAKNLSERIDIAETESELGQLATTLNDAFSRLENSFRRQLQFTSDASHELRTPLSIALTHQELALSKERSAEEYRKAIETAHRANQRMKGLIDSLLTLARMDADDTPIKKQNAQVLPLIQEVVELVQPLAESKQLVISQPTETLAFFADPDKLSQVLINLVTNAIQFSPEKGRITISVSETDTESTLSIFDQGPGISEAHLAHLFERFYRVDDERSRERGGTGLGLAICHSIMEAHGGEISVTSEPGQGSCFTIQLPRAT